MNRPWMPLYIADYLADTAHLGALQSGAYLHLIMHYWQTDGLPGDDRALARIARMTDREWKANRATLAAFFTADWRHKRIDEEIGKATAISEKRRAAAEEKHNRSRANAGANAHANAEQKHTHARTFSQPQSQDSSSLRSEHAREVEAEFDRQFWPAWPNKVGKPDALRAFAKARRKHDLGAILDGVQRYIANKPVDRPWLNPATFLNQERFNDAPAAVARGSPRAQSGSDFLAQLVLGNGYGHEQPSSEPTLIDITPGAP